MQYHEAARIITAAGEKKAAVKSLVLSSSFNNKKLLFALVCETLKYSTVLTQILEATKIEKYEKTLRDRSLTLVLLYDFLIGKGINGANKLKVAVTNHKAALQSELARMKVKAGAKSNKELLPEAVRNEVALPRYVRVNLLKTCTKDVEEHFRREGFAFRPFHGSDWESFSRHVKSLKGSDFTRDLHVPDLLLLAPGSDLHDHTLYKSGDIILQDKASCIPAFVMNPPPGSHVIDCCAAPGNKTSHLASLMGNKGKVFAFDMDAHRLATLTTLTLKAGALCIEAKNQDFLKVDPNDPKYSKVKYILVDPSCSGSGIVSRKGAIVDDSGATAARLEKLAKFQISIVKHALSFPSVERVVYSTCSVHQQENEDVVQEVLRSFQGEFALEEVLPKWTYRGVTKDFSDGNKCIRLSPENGLTNGFFVACFQRVSSPGRNAGGSTVSGAVKVGDVVESSENGSEVNKGVNDGKDNLSANAVGNVSAKKKKKKKKRKIHEVDSETSNGVSVSEKNPRLSGEESNNDDNTTSNVTPEKCIDDEQSQGSASENGPVSSNKKYVQKNKDSSHNRKKSKQKKKRGSKTPVTG